jgi:hypothetical protein
MADRRLGIRSCAMQSIGEKIMPTFRGNMGSRDTKGRNDSKGKKGSQAKAAKQRETSEGSKD